MADYHDPLPGAHLGGNNYPTGLISRKNMWHTSEHGLGRASKNNNHLSYDNQILEVRHNFIWQIETVVFTQRGRNPLHSVRFFHGTISVQSILINNHDHGKMGKQRLPAAYPHPFQWPQKGHQYPHDKHASFLHNKLNRSCIPHNRTQQHRPTKAEPKQTRMIT